MMAAGPVYASMNARQRSSAGMEGCASESGTMRASASGAALFASPRSGQRYARATSPRMLARSPWALSRLRWGNPKTRNARSLTSGVCAKR